MRLVATWLMVIPAIGATLGCNDVPVPTLKRSLLLPPPQPIVSTLSCTRMTATTIAGEQGDWTLSGSDGGCTFADVAPEVITATAAEMIAMKHRPAVRFLVSPDGRMKSASVIRSSGSVTLDEKAVQAMLATPHRKHDCGLCTATRIVNVEFNGPVWVRD